MRRAWGYGWLMLLAAGCVPTDDVELPVVPRSPVAQRPGPDSIVRPPRGRVIDLTHPFDADTIYWPTEAGFKQTVLTAGRTERGYYYSANSFQAPEHGGTHVDAPVHFWESGTTADRLPLERLMGEAVVIDVTAACQQDADYLVSIADLQGWEQRYSRQLVEVIVLLHTGYSRHWPDRTKYLGTDQRGEAALTQLRFPGLDPDAARWLAQQRLVLAVGIDTASIDRGRSREFGSHVVLAEQGIPVLENVAHLDRLPATGAYVIALPMKIARGTGGPVRIVAVVDEGEGGG